MKQILEGRQVKRGIAAHLTTIEALFGLYAESFFNDKADLFDECVHNAEHLNQACNDGNDEDIQKAQADVIHTIESLNVVNQVGRLDESVASKPPYRATHQYMQMVVEMLIYITAVWPGDWNLHMDAIEM